MELLFLFILLSSIFIILVLIPSKDERELKFLYKDANKLLDNCDVRTTFIKSINPIYSRIELTDFNIDRVENLRVRIESKANELRKEV